MNDEVAPEILKFIRYVNEFYEEVESYIETTSLRGKKQQIEVDEDYHGRYTIDKLTLFDEKDREIAEFIPVAAFVIAGSGLIYADGEIDRYSIVHMELGEGSRAGNRRLRSRSESRGTVCYKKFEIQGWYWMENSDRLLGHIFSEDVFGEILWRVANYEIK